MRGHKSFVRSAKMYQRGTPRGYEISDKVLLIVTEGEKTEPNYLKALCDRLRLSATDIEIVHPEGTDPLTLVRTAVDLRNKRKNAAKKGFSVEYDEVWVVFDMERPHDERRRLAVQAKALPEASEIKFACSDPCFEYWLLLHEEYTTASFADWKAVVRRLKKHWKDYAKGQQPTHEFLQKVPTAVTHAERCRVHHRNGGGDGNPSTEVDRLVRSMNDSTRPHLRYAIPSE
ncbi:MAG TPA: hypothetical protein DCZ95_11665 [Verrucomicrobia bacterium]|nr:MAG: hypothetical protein A2X46_01760 [Lentisphaerae bacterium GWF2_57_35]HBA84742.1 hypothetical protein [Verrucomicrobiota bacterium]